MQALPQAAYFLFLEASVGGTIALFWVHLRGEVPRGFTLFTGTVLLILGALGQWLRFSFPPTVTDVGYWFALERTLNLAFLVLLAIYLVRHVGQLAPVIPLLGLIALWSAANVNASGQLLGLGTPLAVLAGAMALGTSLAGLSLGHWYLVSPTMAVQPLIRLTLLCLGTLLIQLVLLPLEILLPGARPDGVQLLLGDYALFLGVRVIFGILVPIVATFMTWRTARIRSLDSATGLLYIVTALILAGEIAARTLFFLTGIAT